MLSERGVSDEGCIIGRFVIVLTMNEVVGSEESSSAASSNTVHGTRLQVHKKGPGDVLPPCRQNGMYEARNGQCELKGVRV